MTTIRCRKCGEKMVEVRKSKLVYGSGKSLIITREYVCPNGCEQN